jgi:hypothetical protein
MAAPRRTAVEQISSQTCAFKFAQPAMPVGNRKEERAMHKVRTQDHKSMRCVLAVAAYEVSAGEGPTKEEERCELAGRTFLFAIEEMYSSGGPSSRWLQFVEIERPTATEIADKDAPLHKVRTWRTFPEHIPPSVRILQYSFRTCIACLQFPFHCFAFQLHMRM